MTSATTNRRPPNPIHRPAKAAIETITAQIAAAAARLICRDGAPAVMVSDSNRASGGFDKNLI